MKKYITTVFLATQLFAFGGIGAYGNLDMFSANPSATSDGSVSVNPGRIDNAYAIGFFAYLDILPIIDLQVDYELAGNLYNGSATVTSDIATVNYPINDIPWARVSGYYTLRKEIIGASIPFLARVQVYGGLGLNTHTITPTISTDVLKATFPNMTELEDIVAQDFTSTNDDLGAEGSDNDPIDLLIDYADANAIESSGFHLQVGAQAKVLVANMFINARYTIAKDVVPGSSGFPSIWVGLAFGF